MKSIKRMFVSVIAFVMIFSIFSCIPFAASAEGETNWALSFVQKVDGAYATVTSVEPGETYYLAVGVKDFSAIGEMTVAKDEDDAVDYTATAYDNTITAATVILDCSALGTVDATAIETPYASATVETNYADGQLRVIVWADKASGGLDYSIGQAELADNNGVLFYVPVTAGDTEGTASYTFNAGSSSAAASIATINKAAGTEFSALTHVASIAMGGYDVAYALSIAAAPVGPTYVETLIIPGLNVKFESDYTLGVYVAKDVYESYNEAYIVAKKEIYSGNELTGYDEVTLTEATLADNYYIFEYAGFAAREMSSMVSLTLNAKDADGKEYYGPEKTYSLKTYAMNQLGKSTTKATFKTMMVDFLNYGAAAQTYFGYNTANLANADADEYQSLATADRTLVKCTAGTDDSSYETQIVGFNLEFVSKINIAAYVKVSDDKAQEMQNGWYASVTYTDFDNQLVTKRVDLSDEASFFKAGSYWIVTFNGLASKEMSTAVTFTLYDANGVQKSNAATYSIESYAASKSTSSTANLPELVKSMMKFGDAAAAYFA